MSNEQSVNRNGSGVITVKTWVITIVIGMLLSALTFAFTSGAQSKQVVINTTAIDYLNKEIPKKLDRNDPYLIEMVNTMNRIEVKLDEHIAKK